MANFAGGLQHVGRGIVVLDAFGRVGNVLESKRQGSNWQKLAAQEMTGMNTGFLAGGVAANMAIGALTVALGATPVGWVIAIGVGLTVGFSVGSAADRVGKSASGWLYDKSNQINWF